MNAIVELKDLRVEYRPQISGQPRKVAVKDLTLKVNAGEVFGFLGPNGAGKTTTMNVLLGFVNATAGDAFDQLRFPRAEIAGQTYDPAGLRLAAPSFAERDGLVRTSGNEHSHERPGAGPLSCREWSGAVPR